MKEDTSKLTGLHRPYNKPLKSLVWVCKFVQKNKNKISHSNLYLKFYISHLKEIASKEDTYPYSKDEEGLISPQTAKLVLQDIKQLTIATLQKKISEILVNRPTINDKRLFRTYKNTSYYITLAKNLKLFNSDFDLSEYGQRLAKSHSKYYKLSKSEQITLFVILFEANFDLLLSLALSKKSQKKYEAIDIPIYQLFLREHHHEILFKYIKSHEKNYVEVIDSWFNQLELFNHNNSIKIRFIRILLNDLRFKKSYNLIKEDYSVFEKNTVANLNKVCIEFINLEKSYNNLIKQKKSDSNFVNLYDIKNSLHQSYNKFNNLLNLFYNKTKRNNIILFSNIVYSIDSRPRFIVNGKAVLKIKIIKKIQYGN